MGQKSRKLKRTPSRSRPQRTYPWYFRVIWILLPLALVAGVEGAFRLTGVARPPSLFIKLPVGFRTFLQINPRLGQRFFPPSMGNGIPVPSFQVLPEVKPPGTRRILCLGESTTAGFPYPVHGSFPAILQQILEERDPSRRWEVTNCAMTGISASTVVDLMPEVLAVHPDALVIYLGQNEFYGIGGVGSRGSAGAGVLASLGKLRLIRWLQSRVTPKREPGTLMERMVKRASIPIGDRLRAHAYGRYRGYIRRILDEAAQQGVPVVLCEVVSNERDFYPFGSEGKAEIPDAAAWRAGPPASEIAKQLLPALDKAVAGDSMSADLAYLRGMARLRSGTPGWQGDFRRARNLDTVPFRAPDPINGILREEAAAHGVPLVPTERIFRQSVADGVPGAESFVEHLHPTFLGNARIASAAADELLHRPYAPITEADAGRWLRACGLTRIDLALGDDRIDQLMHRWPYTRQGRDAPPYPYRARSMLEEAAGLLDAAGDSAGAAYMRGRDPEEDVLAEAVLRKSSDLLRSHTALARERAQRRDFEGSRREYRAAVRLLPIDWGLWTEFAECCHMLGDREETRAAAEQALSLNPGAERARELLAWADSATPAPPSAASPTPSSTR